MLRCGHFFVKTNTQSKYKLSHLFTAQQLKGALRHFNKQRWAVLVLHQLGLMQTASYLSINPSILASGNGGFDWSAAFKLWL